MTSGGGQDWRGGRAPRTSGRPEEATPSWKQSPHAPAARVRAKSLWPKLRIAAAIVFLIALVAAVIAAWDPAKEHRTHVVMLNLMDGSLDFDTAAPLTLPEGIETATNTRVVTLCHPSTLALSSKAPADRSNLDAADSVVINLQTTFVPGPNGEFQCLIRTSTPDMDTNQFADLGTLKSQLDALDPSQSVLLLVDSPPTSWEWRTGCMHSSLVGEFEKWTAAKKNLVVLMSSSSNGLSEPGTAGTNGKSIFGHFASIGFSNLADQNLDQKLTVAEFCGYVTDHTKRWVRDHRNVAGQSVTVLPALDSLSKGDRDVVLVTDLIQLPNSAQQIGGKSNADLAAIEKQWMLREALQMRGGPRWNPLLWKSATDDLIRAEKAFLYGQDETARRALTRSTATLRELETLTNEICPQPESIHAERGLALSDFNEFPSLDRVQPVLFPAAAGDAGAVARFTSAEDVLAANTQGFPFSSVGLKQPADLDSIRSRRAAAEAAVAEMLGCADQLELTVRRLESSLLLSEDRHFTRPMAVESASTEDSGEARGDARAVKRVRAVEQGSSEDSDPDALITAIREFTDVQNRAETTLVGLLETAPSLAFWAADSAQELSKSDRDDWRKVLAGNAPEITVTGDSLSAMFDPLKGIGEEASSGNAEHERSAQELRKEIFRLLVYGRGLQRSLLFKEPVEGFTADGLQTVTAALKSAQNDASRSQRTIQDLLEKICSQALGEKPAKRAGQVRARDFLRTLLSLTSIRPETRMSVLRSLQDWDAKFASADPPQSEADVQDDASLGQSGVAEEALWMLQVVNLLPEPEKQSALLGEAWNAAKLLAADDALDDASRHDAAFRLGKAIREIWKQNQEHVGKAVKDTGSNAHSLLRAADQRARLFSGFDAGSKSLRSPTERLRELNRIRYCLMHADRLLSGLWIEPGDSAPLLQNGWYAKATESWLTAASKCEQRLSDDAMGTPASIVELIGQLESRLSRPEELELTFGTEQSDLDLREKSKGSGTIKGAIRMTGSAGISGEAAVFVRLESDSPIVVENNAQALPVGEGAQDAVLELRRLADPGMVDCVSVAITPETFFRGRFRKAELAVIVDPCAPAEFVVDKKARSQTASVKVSGADPRPIVLILDFSGSMNEPLSSNPKTLKFLEALATLDSLIDKEELTGARVILNVYGHRTRYIKDLDRHEPNQKYIDNFGKGVAATLRADDDITKEFDETISANDPVEAANVRSKFKTVLKKLEASQPWGTTPLIKAITEALTTTLKGEQGIVIAVTDGQAEDDTPTKKTLLERALAGNLSTSVNVVAFDVNQNVEQRKLLSANFAAFPAITVDDASDHDKLLAKIFETLDRRKYRITSPSGKRTFEAYLETATENLPPAPDYSVQFGQMTSPEAFALNGGDQLQLDLDRENRRFLFRRQKRAVSKVVVRGQVNGDAPGLLRSLAPPRLSDLQVGQNPEMGKAELRLMLDHERDDLPVRQPAEIEFAVRPASSESTFRPAVIHQVFTSEAGAPGWNLTIDEWPKRQLFLVDAIWKMDRTPAQHVIPWKDLKAADSIDEAVPVREIGLPEFGVWVTLRENELEVRLDPITVVRKPETPRPLSALGDELALNRVEDVRIEIGVTGTAGVNAAFLPWEVETRVIRLETGSVRYVFSGDQISRATVADAEIAFTSAAARKEGAFEVRDFRIE